MSPLLIPGDLECRELVELVTDYVEGALAPAERSRFEQHLVLCPDCINYVEQMRATIAAVGALREEAVDPRTRDALLPCLPAPEQRRVTDGRTVLAYKFLRPGRVGPFTGFRWPAPAPAAAGAWVVAGGEVRLCDAGVHACSASDLPYWIAEELWRVELADPVPEGGRKLVGARGRLAARIDAWTPAVSYELAEACAWRTRDRAVDVMRAARLNAEAAELASVGALDDLGIAAGALSDACRVREPAVAAGYVADVAAHAQPAPARGSAFAATTAAYIAAHAAAHAVGSAHAFTAEREWQAGWLAQRLSLE